MTKKEQPLFRHSRIVIISIVGATVIVGIILLKSQANDPVTATPQPETPSAITATPDIGIADTSDIAVGADSTVIVAVSDSVGTDPRPPYEAGYEDGYNNGIDDGHGDSYKASYDEGSMFRDTARRHDYARGYRTGYDKGYNDAREGNEYNMSPHKGQAGGD